MSSFKNLIQFLSLFTFYLIANGSVCGIISPNNDPLWMSNECVNGTTTFFDPEYPGKNFNEECICCSIGNGRQRGSKCYFGEVLQAKKGRINCNADFGCCHCGGIVCDDCIELYCGGDQACLGVSPIHINGSNEIGATMACNGDVSCFKIFAEGLHVKSLQCNGDHSCGNSTFIMNKYIDTQSSDVKPMFVSFTGDNSAAYTTVEAYNVGSLDCAGDDSCPNSNLTLYCEESCPLKINGDRAAAHAIWNIINARFLDANGDKSLSYSDLNIEMDNDGGSLIVSGDDAATYASWIIKNANKLTCSGYQACKNSRFSIQFIPENKNNRVTVSHTKGAYMADWDLINPSLIDCRGNLGCHMANINATCIDEDIGCKVSCSGIDACKNSKFKITNGNSLSCIQSNACRHASINMECLEEGCPIKCNAGCNSATLDISYSNGLTCIGSITVDALKNIDEGACQNGIFKLSHNIGGEILCNGKLTCANANIFDPIYGAVQNLKFGERKGIVCKGVRSCYNANIVAECGNKDKGCSIQCDGAEACGSNDRNNIIDLKYVTNIRCKGGVIPPSIFRPGCYNRTFIMTPSKKDDIVLMCLGKYSCQDSILNTTGIDDEDKLMIKDVKCDGIYACYQIEFNVLPKLDQNTIIKRFSCNSKNSCENMVILFNLQDISDEIDIKLLECNNVDACKNVEIIIQVNNVPLTADEIEEKIEEGTLKYKIKCDKEIFCANATIAGTLRTFITEAGLNSDMYPGDIPVIIDHLHALWITLGSVILIGICCGAFKMFKRRDNNLKKNMAESMKNNEVTIDKSKYLKKIDSHDVL